VRRWETRTGTRHHIIDPRTGTSASSGIVAAVVLADEAWWAEGVAKAAIVAGAVKGAAMVERLALGGWLVREDRCVIPVGSVRVRGAA
jgi:thiamine biosynthesis lipoprotein